jgi:death on curing protein
VIYLDLDELLHVAGRVLGEPPIVRDAGLLQSALARPQASAGGRDAYVSVHEKAAALLHSLCRNHSLVDGNKRLALAGTIAFYGMNGFRLDMTNEEAYDLVTNVVTSESDDVHVTSKILKAASRRRRRL